MGAISIAKGNAVAPTANGADAIREQVGSLNVVVPTASRSATAVYGNANRTTGVVGAVQGYLDARAWSLVSGRYFSAAEIRAGKSVCVIGETVRAELFGDEDALGANVRVGKVACHIIGVRPRPTTPRRSALRRPARSRRVPRSHLHQPARPRRRRRRRPAARPGR